MTACESAKESAMRSKADIPHDRRERDFLFARGLAPGILFDVGHGEERMMTAKSTMAIVARLRDAKLQSANPAGIRTEQFPRWSAILFRNAACQQRLG